MFVASVKAVPNAPIEVAKQIAPEAINPGLRAGKITSTITSQDDAPSERAASSRAGSSLSAEYLIVKITLVIEIF